MKNIPVLLLTGYLGSGKTTLVNKILTNRRGIKFAVIVNDIGEVNIDADLIQKGGVVGKKDDSLVALQNGCICCTLKTDLINQLSDIIIMNKFDYIVIEASGICEPQPIAQTICSMPKLDIPCLKDGYPVLDSIVTVVDALRMKDEFKNGGDLLNKNLDEDDIENLLIQQIEFCNTILLNKVSEVKKEDLARVKQIIRTLQPKANIIECDYAEVDLDKIIGCEAFDFDEVATSARWISEIEGKHHDDEDEDEDEHEHEHEHEHHHHHHEHEHEEGEAEEYGIGTYVYMARRPFDLSLFDNFVAKQWPRSIIRAKGLCYFINETHICYLFEQAGKQVSMQNVGQWFATMPDDELQQMMENDPVLRRDWDPVYGDRMQKIVFIGQHLEKDEIKKLLDACLI
ncbi:MAG: GTP-binding protein [Alistipes sp.]|nr:GTP-binding protein [Candidatus Alistipes equi]